MPAPKLSQAALADYGPNAGFVAELREQFDVDPSSVDACWAEWFQRDAEAAADVLPVGDSSPPTLSEATPAEPADPAENARAIRLIHAFRSRGHRIARSDPLGGGALFNLASE